MPVTLWEVLTVISPILAPILALALGGLGRFVWGLHRTNRKQDERINELEQLIKARDRTLFGDNDNPMDSGLATEVKEMRGDLDKVANEIQSLKNLLSQHQNPQDNLQNFFQEDD